MQCRGIKEGGKNDSKQIIENNNTMVYASKNDIWMKIKYGEML